jgi:hypothetical protein
MDPKQRIELFLESLEDSYRAQAELTMDPEELDVKKLFKSMNQAFPDHDLANDRKDWDAHFATIFRNRYKLLQHAKVLCDALLFELKDGCKVRVPIFLFSRFSVCYVSGVD